MASLLLLASLLISQPSLQQTAEVRARFNGAVELQRQGDLKRAAEEYRALLAIAPDYAEAHANFGGVLSRLGHYKEAVTAYEAALRINPELIPVLLNLGIAHYRAGEFAKAADGLRQFIARSPDHLQAHQLLGISLVELDRNSESIEHLEPTLAVPAPEDITALYYLGIAYSRLGRPEIESVIHRLAAHPRGNPLASMLQGQSHLQRYEFDLAAAKLETAAKTSPDLPRLQGMLGLAYFKLGRLSAAIACFERELGRSPNDSLMLYYLAYAHDRQGNLTAARERAEAALKQDSQSPEANKLLSQILFKQGQAAAALEFLEKAIARQPLDSESRFLRARIYRQLGRAKDAAREFAEVEQLKSKERERENVHNRRP